MRPQNAEENLYDGHRITSYNVCYTKLLRDFDGFGETTDFGGAEGIQSLADAMKKHGFTESEIDKVRNNFV